MATSLASMNFFGSSAKIAIGILRLLMCSACGVWATIISMNVVDKVNKHLPENQRFGQLWWGLGKRLRLRREYRRQFPDGRDLRRLDLITALALGALVILAIDIGLL